MAYNTKAVGVAYSDPEFSVVNATGYISADQFINNTTAGPIVQNINAGLYFLSTAITANTTTTTAPKGSIGTTSNATGAGKMFISDGTKWQFAAIT